MLTQVDVDALRHPLNFQPRPDVSSRRIYVHKGNRLLDFDLGSYDVLLIPEWPSGCGFQLLSAPPLDCFWDSRNEAFKRRAAGPIAAKPVFDVIFQRGGPASGLAGYLIVAMGRTLCASHVENGFDGGSVWCDARYRQIAGDLDDEAELRILNEDLSQKTVFGEVAGVTMKCLVRPLFS